MTEYQAEIERLQAKIERWEAQSIAQYAEITRLRAALQDIAEDPYAIDGGAAEIARRALEPKP